jgi:hypothetical protein
MAAKKRRTQPAIRTRDPQPKERDPQPAQPRKKRRYISANMPTVCPDCGRSTRHTGGKHTDPVDKRILEYRECIKCKLPLTCGRPMTLSEIERYCTHAEAVADYEDAKKHGEA